MSYYPMMDIIEMIGKKKIGYDLKEEYKSIERMIDEIREDKTERYANVCVREGKILYLKYLHENGCQWDNRICAEATGGGQIGCLKYLHENGCPWDKWTCAYAAEKGQIECLRYAHENGCPWDDEDMMMYSCGECEEYYETHMKKKMKKVNV
jgi:hypothetical protein